MKTKNLKSLYALIAFLGALAPHGFADNSIPAPTASTQSPLGMGYASEKEKFVGKCLSGTTEFAGSPEASLNFEQSVSQSELADSLGFAAGARFRYGVATVSASAKFFSSSQSTNYSLSAVYTGTYKFKSEILPEPTLTQLGTEMRNNFERWPETCGDEFIYQRDLGAKIFFSIRVDFASEFDKSMFEANASLSAPMASVSAEFKKASSRLSKRTKITVGALQIGGKVEKLSSIFGVSQTAGTATPEVPEAISNTSDDDRVMFVQCSMGDFEKCFSVLKTALVYATDTRTGFPSQIAPELGTGNPGGPAILSYQTKSYKSVGLYPTNYPLLKEEVAANREYIASKFEANFKNRIRAEYLLKGKAMRLSDPQRARIREVEQQIGENVRKILAASKTCYEEPDICPAAKQRLTSTETGLQDIDEKKFNIVPESFAQYCDLSQSALPKPSLKFIVGAVIEKANEIDAGAFAAAGESADPCSITEDVIRRTDTLVLEGKNITELDAIAAFTHLRVLNLNNNQIQAKHLKALKGYAMLEELYLSQNKIDDVSALSEILSLSHLDLSENLVLNAGPLQGLVGLTRLDLRNNAPGVKCPLVDTSACLLGDYVTTNSFAPIRYSRASRLEQATSLLLNGDVLITGGNTTSDAVSEIYSQKYGFVGLPWRNVEARRGHSSTTLKDGRVLLAGGVSSDTAEIYDPILRVFVASRSKMHSKRAHHTATLLPDGKVLLVGGWTSEFGVFTGTDPSGSGEVYDPTTDTFTPVANPLSEPRAEHTATLLKDGTVLIVGGFTTASSLRTAEIYLPASNQFAETGRLNAGRGSHAAAILPDGRVLVAGGWSAERQGQTSAEIYYPTTRSFKPTRTQMEIGRGWLTATSLDNGLVLLAGGARSYELDAEHCTTCERTAEIYDPAADIFAKLGNRMSWARAAHTATLMPNGFVLILGGMGQGSDNTADLFEYQR